MCELVWCEYVHYVYGMKRRVPLVVFGLGRLSDPPSSSSSSSSSSGQSALLLRRGHVTHPRLTAGGQSHHRVPRLCGVPAGTGEGAQEEGGGGAPLLGLGGLHGIDPPQRCDILFTWFQCSPTPSTHPQL